MSLTFSADGQFAGQTIRITPDKRYASIYDIMRVAGVGRDRTNAWNDLKPRLLSVGVTSEVPQVMSYKFTGRGQRDTPVINGQGLVRLLFMLPGVKARQFVAESAETLVRFIGGDESLVEQIRRNRDVAISDPNSTQAFMAANIRAQDGPLEELSLVERRNKLERDQEEIKRLKLDNSALQLSVLKDYEDYAMEKIADPRIREQVQNEIVNQMLGSLNPALTKPMLQIENYPLSESSLVTIDQVATQEMNLHLSTNTKSKVGREVVALFRQRFPDQDVPTVLKYVNGEMRQVKAYPRSFMDAIKEQIRVQVVSS